MQEHSMSRRRSWKTGVSSSVKLIFHFYGVFAIILSLRGLNVIRHVCQGVEYDFIFNGIFVFLWAVTSIHGTHSMTCKISSIFLKIVKNIFSPRLWRIF